ncbi:MAG TPA: sugar kinase [Firmicutes bacterium]|jgi:xylulokinase|nr:FGGY-family carbohydrate kinase [Bacillota bacterium]HHT43601.1 sugar kinase [Bacillota bacterium]
MFLGVDIGTTGLKTCLVDREGRVIRKAYRKLRTYGLDQNKRELNPQEIFAGVLETIQEAAAGLGSQVELITVSSLGEAIVPVDKTGQPLMNSMIGTDPRGSEELAWIKGLFPPEELTRITGLNLSSIYSLNKIMYLKRNEPSIFEHTWKFFCIADYVLYMLTGAACMDYSLASRTMAFDFNEYKWSEKILGACGVSAELLPTPVPCGTVVGTLHRELAQELGLPPETKAAVGGHDHIFNAIGSGAVTPGVCSNAVGTTEGFTAYLGQQRLDTKTIAENNISCQPFVLPNTFNTVAWHNTAGALLNWFAATFFAGWPQQDVPKILNDMNAACKREPSRLMVLPHFAGSTTKHMDERAKGAILGLTVFSTKEEIYKALLEGSTYELMMIFQALLTAGVQMDRIVVSGGGSNSPVWLQTKADVLGRPITRVACAETGAVGSAILAAVNCGHYKSLAEAAEAMVEYGETIEPDQKYHALHLERFEEYQTLYERLRPLNHLLAD